MADLYILIDCIIVQLLCITIMLAVMLHRLK